MGFDSNGNWSSDFYPIADRDNGVAILASKFQTLIQTNLKESFDNCILRDGTGKPTANTSWDGNKITDLANGTNAYDAVNKGQLDAAVAVEATEEQKGVVYLSTEAQALAGTDDTTAMTPLKVKNVINTLTTTTAFAINSGYATSGAPDLLSGLTTDTLSFKVDDGTSYKILTATTANKTPFTLTSVESKNISGLSDGTYNVFVDPDGHSYVYANKVYKQPSQPSLNVNDIWLNTCEPYHAYIKTADGVEETNLVQLPQTITVASAVISSINPVTNFNDNGVLAYYDYVIERGVSNGISYVIYKSGWCEQTAYKTADGQVTSVSFGKTFNSTPTVIISPVGTAGMGRDQQTLTIVGPSTTGFQAHIADTYNYIGFYWKAEGYINL